MNISTATLLNMLSPTLGDNVKQNIEQLSDDGKIDLSTVIKDKSIKTVLEQLTKDLLIGGTTKQTVSENLQNNKQSFSYKTLSEDIKTVVKFLQQQLPTSKTTQTDTNLTKDINIKQNESITKEANNTIQNQTDNKNISNKILNQTITKQPSMQNQNSLNQNDKVLNQTDTKTINNTIITQETTKEVSTKILNQISILKDSLIDIKNLDTTTLKSNISNSGVFLESKLAKYSLSISSSVKKLLPLLQKQITQSNTTQNLTQSKQNIREIKDILQELQPKLKDITPKVPITIKSDIEQVSKEIKTLQTEQNSSKQQPIIKNLSIKISNLQERFLNSEFKVLFENNTSINENISRDLKTVVLQLQDQVSDMSTLDDSVKKDIKITLDKIQSQIEYFQLLSFSSSSNHTYLSFFQDDIEDVDIKFNSLQDDSVSCQINLNLIRFGELKVLLVLDKKTNLNINIGIENPTFKQKIQNNLQKLRVGINSIGLMLQSLNVFDINHQKDNSSKNSYNTTQTIDFGLDIKV